MKPQMDYYIPLEQSADEYMLDPMRGRRILSADEVVNIRKEPIEVDLEVHQESPDHRNIRQAPVNQLDRIISIPKDELDLYYSVCDDDIHIKSVSEIQRERDAQGKVDSEKQKHLNKIQNFVGSNAELMVNVHSVAPLVSIPTRKLISNSTVEARVDSFDSTEIMVLRIPSSSGDLPNVRQQTYPAPNFVNGHHMQVPVAALQKARKKTWTPITPPAHINNQQPLSAVQLNNCQPAPSQSYNVVPEYQREVPERFGESFNQACPDQQGERCKEVLQAPQSMQNNQKHKRPALRPALQTSDLHTNKQSSHVRITSQRGQKLLGLVENAVPRLQANSAKKDEELLVSASCMHSHNNNGLPSTPTLTFKRSRSTGFFSDGAPPNKVISGPPSPTGLSRQEKASSFWRSHSSEQDLQAPANKISMSRLNQLSDTLTGLSPGRNGTCQQRPTVYDVLNVSQGRNGTCQQRPTVYDVLNVSQEELSMIESSQSQVKSEPVNQFTESVTPESSDDEIIWDDEVEILEEVEEDRAAYGVLDIHPDGDDSLSESEYLLDRVDELLK